MLAGLVLFIQPASAQTGGNIVLEPEEAVTLRLDGPGGAEPVVTERGRAAWTDYDIAVARNFVAGSYDAATGNNTVPLSQGKGVPETPPIAPDQLRLRFMSVAGQHTQLILENGHDRALVYRARITRRGQSAATDVCVVPPNNRSTEHWPEQIERIELSDLRLVPWQEGQRINCE